MPDQGYDKVNHEEDQQALFSVEAGSALHIDTQSARTLEHGDDDDEDEEFHGKDTPLTQEARAAKAKAEAERPSKVKKAQQTGMKVMKLLKEAKRAPTHVGERRGLAMCALIVLFGVLILIVVIEGILHSDTSGLKALQSVATSRRDVYLLRFSSNGVPVKWSDTQILANEDFLRTTINALAQVPFHEYSVEMKVDSADDQVEIACIEEELHKIVLEDFHCSANEANVIKSVSTFSVPRCEGDNTSPLRNAVKCANKASTLEESAAENAELVKFWLTTFAEATQGSGLTSRCCDYDHVIVDKGELETLKMCRADIHSLKTTGIRFYRYYGHETTTTCTSTICNCECFGDTPVTQGKLSLRASQEGCPMFPVNSRQFCSSLVTASSDQPTCASLPEEASKFDASSKGFKFGTNPRCYGNFVG
mmetsp:Transcript_17583/g.32321  ORF Transcript_17583/g.32321 Transcript_17583/m.32321 type:complete len:421 (-) Transcript_17583:112-1374(-)